MTALRLIDLFSGIGGFRIAAEALGIMTVASCENDAYARKTYSQIFGISDVEVDDIRHTTRPNGEELGHVLAAPEAVLRRIRKAFPPADIITAGLPCQPHSLMGNRRGLKDLRGQLFFDTVAVVQAITPRLVVLENVRALKSVNDGALYAAMTKTLNEMGYRVRSWVLDAQHYGVPQVRRRLFIVGSRIPLPDTDPPRVPDAERCWLSTWHLLERTVAEKYYLSDRILKTVMAHQHKGYRRKAEINRLIARPLTRTMHKMHRASQDNYYSDDFVRGTYDEETHTVQLSGDVARIRRITPREALRIQAFPEDAISAAIGSGVSDTQLYMQAGNAVPPPLVQALLTHVLPSAQV